MKQWFFTILFVFIISISCTSLHSKLDTKSETPDIFHLKNSTVILLNQIGSQQYQPYCAGVWISPYHFITANHCANSEEILFQVHANKFNNSNGIFHEAYSGITLAKDSDRDLALVLAFNENHSIALLADNAPNISKVWALGHPSNLLYSISGGIISSKRTMDKSNQQIKFLQTDASIGPGNSGGGLFNSNSELLGICSFVTTTGAKFGFFVDVEEIKLFLNPDNIYFTQ